MAKIGSKYLVIDASIARASGDKNATYPKSVHCRNFLSSVLEICHQIVMTPDIKREWDKHQSIFALRWRRQMIAKKKLHVLDISINRDLWSQVENFAASISDRRIQEMTKDLCLIEAALASDKIIISDDDKARGFFSDACITVRELKNIIWVNPDKIEEEKPIEWLRNGAESESDRLLVNYQSN